MIKQILSEFVIAMLFLPGFMCSMFAITDLFEGKRTVLKYQDGKWLLDREDAD